MTEPTCKFQQPVWDAGVVELQPYAHRIPGGASEAHAAGAAPHHDARGACSEGRVGAERCRVVACSFQAPLWSALGSHLR